MFYIRHNEKIKYWKNMCLYLELWHSGCSGEIYGRKGNSRNCSCIGGSMQTKKLEIKAGLDGEN